MLISLVLLVETSNSCVSDVATEYISPFFCCTGPYYLETCLYIIQIIFFCILVSLKKGFHQEFNGIFGINVNFSD